MTDFLKKGLRAKRESKAIEFKESLDVTSSGEWCELIKDIVAIANSGGGVIMIGLDNHGEPSSYNANPLLKFEPADITTKIHKYTGVNLEFEIVEQRKGHKKNSCDAHSHGLNSNRVFKTWNLRYRRRKAENGFWHRDGLLSARCKERTRYY